MSLIKGIYAASMSVLNDDLTLNVEKTIEHAEMVIDKVVMELQYLEAQDKLN
jgi:4-hydroxy-tetrahydrodipicolinate synthase